MLFCTLRLPKADLHILLEFCWSTFKWNHNFIEISWLYHPTHRFTNLNYCSKFPSEHLDNNDKGAISNTFFTLKVKQNRKKQILWRQFRQAADPFFFTSPKLKWHWTLAIHKNYFTTCYYNLPPVTSFLHNAREVYAANYGMYCIRENQRHFLILNTTLCTYFLKDVIAVA